MKTGYYSRPKGNRRNSYAKFWAVDKVYCLVCVKMVNKQHLVSTTSSKRLLRCLDFKWHLLSAFQETSKSLVNAGLVIDIKRAWWHRVSVMCMHLPAFRCPSLLFYCNLRSGGPSSLPTFALPRENRRLISDLLYRTRRNSVFRGCVPSGHRLREKIPILRWKRINKGFVVAGQKVPLYRPTL